VQRKRKKGSAKEKRSRIKNMGQGKKRLERGGEGRNYHFRWSGKGGRKKQKKTPASEGAI